jgi:hypothetical protein
MVQDKYNPKTDVFMGGVLVNLGYITEDQRKKADFLDDLAKKLEKNNPEFKKPLYGHIASGDDAQKVIDEYKRQVDAGKFKPDEKMQADLKRYEGIKLGISGEAEGSDIERKGGPIDNCLKVQKALRDLKELPDSAEKMRETTRGIAEKLQIKYPADKEKHSRLDRHFDVEQLLRGRTDATRTDANIERRIG